MTRPILTFETDKWMSRIKQAEDKYKQAEMEKEQAEMKKEQTAKIAKLALQGFDTEAIAAKLLIPISLIQSILEE